jgi:hypothetical protein
MVRRALAAACILTIPVITGSSSAQGQQAALADIDALEQQIATNAADVDARWKLLYGYFDWASQPSSAALRQRGVEGRRVHILWFIEHQPGDPLLWAGATEGRAIIVPRGHASADPVGFDTTRAAWLRQIDAHAEDEAVIRNAITFILLNDKPLAEELLKRAEKAHSGPTWSSQLGFLYGCGILGLDGLMMNLGPSGFSPEELNGAFAARAKRELEATSDPVVMGTAGYILTAFGGMRERMDQTGSFAFDHALAERLLTRALAAQPNNEQWKTWLGLLRTIGKVR